MSLEIQDLIEAAHWAMRNEDTSTVPTHLSRYYKWLIKMIWAARSKYDYSMHYIDREDLEQQAYLIWLEASSRYDQIRPNSSKKTYIKTRLMWGIRDWYINEMRIVRQYPYFYFQEEEPEFLLDMNFLLYGTSVHPYSLLTPFERYLIFLRYKQEKTILQIAYIIQRSEWHTSRRFNKTIEKLRRAFDASEDTTGYRKPKGHGRAEHSRRPAVQEEGSSAWDSDTPPKDY